ncbi:MAG: hypothetical protein ACI4SG_00460 [Oligosphaeraceae bacterium]
MITAAADKLARRELRRRLPRRGAPWYCAVPGALLCFLAASWMGASLWRIPKEYLLSTPWGWCFLGGVGAGILLFPLWAMTPLYVFGHELTHWLAAKATFHRTGELRLGFTRGAVEIEGSSGLVALAPYVCPLFLLLSGGIAAFVSLLPLSLPPWLPPATAAWLGLCLAYHLVLTLLALKRGQKDLEVWGRFLSYPFILAGNLAALFITLALCSPRPSLLWEVPWELLQEGIDLLGWLLA